MVKLVGGYKGLRKEDFEIMAWPKGSYLNKFLNKKLYKKFAIVMENMTVKK